jgi:hypothetical protein
VLTLGLLAALAFFAFFLVGKTGRRKRNKDARAPGSDALQQLVEEQVVLMVSEGLALHPEALVLSIRTAPDPDIVSAIEKGVARVELVFERRPGAGALRVDLSVEVAFENGGFDRRIHEVSYAWLPSDVVSDLYRSGAARVHRPWQFPWQRRS